MYRYILPMHVKVIFHLTLNNTVKIPDDCHKRKLFLLMFKPREQPHEPILKLCWFRDPK